MQNASLSSLAALSDSELVGQVKALVTRERIAIADLIAHLAELETREIHLREGYPSLYFYCRDALGLSEWEAYNRMEVARLARRFPIIVELLAEGAVHLTAVKLLGPHLTPENHCEILEAARGRSKAGIQELVARLAPQPDVRCSVRRLPVAPALALREGGTQAAQPTHQPGHAIQSTPADSAALDPAVPSEDASMLAGVSVAGISAPMAAGSPAAAVPSPISRAVVMPLSPDRYKFQVTIGSETLEKMRLAKDMLAHAIPSGDDAAILDRAYTALLAELARKKFAHTSRAKRTSCIKSDGADPRGDAAAADALETIEQAAPPPTGEAGLAAIRKRAPRVPSAAVKRAVWLRDLGRCAFVGTGGHRCTQRGFVEFHHVDPYALGGEATVDGIQLRCRRHNDYEGRLYFGSRRPRPELVPEQVPLSGFHSTRSTQDATSQ